MPKLLSVLPCERVVISQKGAATLVNILSSVDVGVPPDIPLEAVAPFTWNVFCSWVKAEDEPLGPYQQVMAIIPPIGQNGAVRLNTQFSFESGKRIHQIHHELNGLQIGKAGLFVIRVWLDDTEGNQLVEAAEYPLLLTHSSIATPVPGPSDKIQ